MNFDLGAVNTILYPSFARQFPDLEKGGLVEQHRITGVGGSASVDSVTLPSLEIQLSSKGLLLTQMLRRPSELAHVFRD